MMPATPRGDLTFIETQLPIARLSVESYTERKAVAGQTLTGLGKWWGRKPLVLCRATILGLLLPATDDPAMDREVFLRLMTMDDDGMLRRRDGNIPVKALFDRLAPSDRARYFTDDSSPTRARWRPGTTPVQKEELQRRVFLSMSYNERLEFCLRPEQIEGPSADSWAVVNAHLGTNAATLQELVAALGQRRFGHVPRVGDAFCGGGSVPFEAARLGCDAYGSDLNPVAALLTWAALNLVGGGPEVAARVQAAQQRILTEVDRQITEWGIEHREPDPVTGRRWRADAYLYCVEARCPECGWRVPLSPSWALSERPWRVVQLVPNKSTKTFDFAVVEGENAVDAPTVAKSNLKCPNGCQPTPISVLRGDGLGDFGPANSKLRGWVNRDVRPRPEDILGERMYCVRWVDTWMDGEERETSERIFAAPTKADLAREEKVVELLMARFDDWQARGIIPSRRIESGAKTDEPMRTRGWTHWHHLFTPRQLLQMAAIAEATADDDKMHLAVGALLGSRVADWNSRLCVWLPSNSGGAGGGKNTFLNQAYNTLFNYSTRGYTAIASLALPVRVESCNTSVVKQADARHIRDQCDVWVTDPPYADAVNYPELSEVFLAWRAAQIAAIFPDWAADSMRSVAVVGAGETFNRAMQEAYKHLNDLMPNNGLQVIMFTHQDAAVWADLALVVWAAGLRVTAAWCIATETGPATGEGNNVQGTVLLVLRKRTSTEEVFLNEIHADIEAEVARQLDSMRAMDDVHNPNFTYTDYQLAAYAAALRVITARPIAEIDPERELRRVRARGEQSPLTEVIESAKKLASDHLVPRGIERDDWKRLESAERFYLKGVELEAHGEKRIGSYQELAHGFGAIGYDDMMESVRANAARLKTPSDMAGRNLRTAQGFGAAPLRDLLFAVCIVARGDSPRDALQWLKTELTADGYREHRRRFVQFADFLAALQHNASLGHWQADAKAAELLAGALRNDHV